MLVCAPASNPRGPSPLSRIDPEGDGASRLFTLRLAIMADAAAIAELIDASLTALLAELLTPAQIAHSRTFMALDRQLIEDRTYFLVTDQSCRIVGCGGWSFRATLSGGDHSAGRDDIRLDPQSDSARIRAMYTRPGFARRGIGRMILEESEKAAARAGFGGAILHATLGGEPLYRACGYHEISRSLDGGVPIVIMGRDITCL